jgi:hypothetical protein
MRNTMLPFVLFSLEPLTPVEEFLAVLAGERPKSRQDPRVPLGFRSGGELRVSARHSGCQMEIFLKPSTLDTRSRRTMEGAGPFVTEHLSQLYFPAIRIANAQSLHPDDSNDHGMGGMISANESLWEAPARGLVSLQHMLTSLKFPCCR